MKSRLSYLTGTVLTIILLTTSPAQGQVTADGISIARISDQPTLEDFAGMTPATALARSMTKVEGFIQRLPDDGDPATQRTEVYIGYTASDLYAIFLAFDSNPNLIRANMAARENIDEDDIVELTIDTFNDQRTAFSFRTTPLGIQWDARWTEGSSRRAGFDTTLEAVWQSDGQLTDQGYMASMSIPLSSLRFSDSAEQTWRVQFARIIPRRNEESYWPPYSIDIVGRLNQTALMRGIRDVDSGNNYQIVPFIFAREVDALDLRAAGGPAFDTDSEQDVGVDAKFIFNDTWVLDVTLNPDFSQVESDQPQVTVNERFEVQFPERRPFFIENADFFATDSTLVFTRRIVDPEGGIRFTGRSGNYGFGSILINDEAPGQNRNPGDPLAGEKATISIIRGYRDISEQDRIGFLATSRELGDGHNRAALVDGRFRFGENWQTQVEVVGTETDPRGGGPSYTGYQRNIQINRTGRLFNNHTHFIEASPGFRTELGFQNRFFRADTSGLHQRVALNFYPENSTINSWNVTGFGVYLEDDAGTKIFSQLGPSAGLTFDTTRYDIGWTDFSEILRVGDFPGLATTRVYKYDNWNIGYNNNTLSQVDLSVSYRSGTTLNLVPPPGSLPDIADTSRLDVDLLVRPFDRLRINNTYLYTELESRNGGRKIFSNKIFRSNWNYQFTKELSLRFIAQYEDTDAELSRLTDDKNLNFDLLLRYVINPWSAFFVGYNSNQSNFDIAEMEGERELIVTDDLKRDGDQFFVKFSYLFQR